MSQDVILGLYRALPRRQQRIRQLPLQRERNRHIGIFRGMERTRGRSEEARQG